MSVPRPQLGLASRSPRRRAILESLGVAFQLVDSSYEENPVDVQGLDPADQAAQLALRKAQAAIFPPDCHGMVIGADTIVVYEDSVLGKPKDRDDARAMLELLSGQTHEVMTGLALVRPTGEACTHTERTRVCFRPLSPADIEWYLDTGEPFDKAGAYAIQGGASLFVERIEGCYFNVVGFPVLALDRLFSRFDLSLLEYIPKRPLP